MTTSARPIITHTSVQTMAEQEHFISANVDTLACFAHARYREEGPGLIAFFTEEFFQKRGQIGKVDLYYLKAEELLPLADRWASESDTRREFVRELWQTIEKYDPTHSIVVSFLSLAVPSPSSRVNTYLVECTTPPPLAYAAYTN